MIRSALVDRPIDGADLLAEVARDSNGATILFLGTVRESNQGRAVSGMEYTAYRSMAECEMAEILREASQRFSTRDIVIEHRLGALRLGDVSVAIAVAHPHRGLAYEASRYIIEQLKKRVPIWKLEHYTDGSRNWVGAGNAHPEPTTTHRADFVTEERRVVRRAEHR
jgi:molybdopterin synthase catalytic subunit